MLQDFQVIHGEALAEMRAMSDASFDAIITDPPYFKKLKNDWDNQWKTRADFVAWVGELCVEWRRLLKPNGSLYVFASPENAAAVEMEIEKHFNVLTHITWDKGLRASTSNRASKEAFRQYAGTSERIIFAEQYGAEKWASGEAGEELRGFVFEPLRDYLTQERNRAGFPSSAAVDKEWQAYRGTKGCMAGHWFGRSQWELPTAQNFNWLRSVLRRDCPDALARPYEELRAEYEQLHAEYEERRRPFFLTAEKEWGDVWHFKPTPARRGRHPCEKPQELMSHIVETSTRPGARVLDCFGGSGSTGEACLRLGRKPVLIELDEKWVKAARDRLEAVAEPEAPGLPFEIAAE